MRPEQARHPLSEDDQIDPATPAGRHRLVVLYGDALYRWAWARAADGPEAEEIAQRTFLAAFARPGRYDSSRGSPWGWLVGLALNEARAVQRERRRPEARTLDPLATGTRSEGEHEETRDHVHRALTSLNPGEQQLLESYYLEGEPMERLATRLGISASTGWARLAHAREALRQALAEEEGR